MMIFIFYRVDNIAGKREMLVFISLLSAGRSNSGLCGKELNLILSVLCTRLPKQLATFPHMHH